MKHNGTSTIYLDHAAMTPTSPEVVAAMLPYYDEAYANPSSLHTGGRVAHDALESARARVAELLGAAPGEIVFTGSGTQADNLAVLGIARAHKEYGRHIIISAIEHKAVLASARALADEGWEITYLPVDRQGLIDVDMCIRAVRPDTVLVSVMYANNEIGTIEPLAELSEALRKKRKTGLPLLHTDACQAAGLLPIRPRELGVDLMALNGSKVYGPRGVGMLYVRDGVRLAPLTIGGAQEHGLHAGTENLPLIVGFAKALEIAEQERPAETKRLSKLRDHFIDRVRRELPEAIINGHPTLRLPNNVHLTVPLVEGESMVLALDAHGIAAATGSACSASDLVPSHVMQALGQDTTLIHGTLRFTLGRSTTKDDVDYVMKVLPRVIERLRSLSALTTSYVATHSR